MKKLYTIQIIPEDSTKAKIYRIKRIWLKLFSWLVCVIAILLCIFIWKFTEINLQLANSWKLKADNERLIKRHAEYEAALTDLDSIYAIEIQIQNILETYLENDSNKIHSILEKNRLKHISSKKVQLDSDFEAEINLNRQNLDVFPNMLPVMGAVISRGYSEEHKALDFAAAMNEPVFATASGKVIFASDKGELGLVVEVDHGGIITRYAHLARFAAKKGASVRKGEIIGFVGNTGNSDGAHLHYEIIFNGRSMNPELFF
ncbi:MAG: M23 family metallopeptidase [Fibromonadaceae bacterium]|jgi:murein DD-endopeptidase MepM/ murein hydrolase activator NlpD|nr:M23 family metallopeptidase [Fibromonadaceae bacterium]